MTLRILLPFITCRPLKGAINNTAFHWTCEHFSPSILLRSLWNQLLSDFYSKGFTGLWTTEFTSPMKSRNETLIVHGKKYLYWLIKKNLYKKQNIARGKETPHPVLNKVIKSDRIIDGIIRDRTSLSNHAYVKDLIQMASTN